MGDTGNAFCEDNFLAKTVPEKMIALKKFEARLAAGGNISCQSFGDEVQRLMRLVTVQETPTQLRVIAIRCLLGLGAEEQLVAEVRKLLRQMASISVSAALQDLLLIAAGVKMMNQLSEDLVLYIQHHLELCISQFTEVQTASGSVSVERSCQLCVRLLLPIIQAGVLASLGGGTHAGVLSVQRVLWRVLALPQLSWDIRLAAAICYVHLCQLNDPDGSAVWLNELLRDISGVDLRAAVRLAVVAGLISALPAHLLLHVTSAGPAQSGPSSPAISTTVVHWLADWLVGQGLGGMESDLLPGLGRALVSILPRLVESVATTSSDIIASGATSLDRSASSSAATASPPEDHQAVINPSPAHGPAMTLRDRLLPLVWLLMTDQTQSVRLIGKHLFDAVIAAYPDPDFVRQLVSEVLLMPSHLQCRYRCLLSLVSAAGVGVVTGDPSLPAHLVTAMHDASLAPHVVELYCCLLRSDDAPTSDWLDRWLRPLFPRADDAEPIIPLPYLNEILQALAQFDRGRHALLYILQRCHDSTVDCKERPTRPLYILYLAAAHTARMALSAGGAHGDMARYMPPAALMHSALRHHDTQVRLTAARLICDSRRTSEYFTSQDLRLLLQYIASNLTMQAPGQRQQLYAQLTKVLLRLRDGYNAARRRLVASNKKRQLTAAGAADVVEDDAEHAAVVPELYRCFQQRLFQLLVASLFPKANFPRRCTALRLLKLLDETSNSGTWLSVSDLWTSAHVRALIGCLCDSYEVNKQIALQLLRRQRALLLELPTDDISSLLRLALQYASSARPPDPVTASYLLQFLLLLPPGCPSHAAFGQLLVETAAQDRASRADSVGDVVADPVEDEATYHAGDVATDPVEDDATDPVEDVAIDHAGDVATDPVEDVATDPVEDGAVGCTLRLMLRLLIRRLDREVSLAGQCITQAALQAPMHGLLLCVRHVVQLGGCDGDDTALRSAVVNEYADVILRLCRAASSAALPVVGSANPEGHLPMDRTPTTATDLRTRENCDSGALLTCGISAGDDMYTSEDGVVDTDGGDGVVRADSGDGVEDADGGDGVVNADGGDGVEDADGEDGVVNADGGDGGVNADGGDGVEDADGGDGVEDAGGGDGDHMTEGVFVGGSRAVTAQTLLICCWRTVKEASLLMGEVVSCLVHSGTCTSGTAAGVPADGDGESSAVLKRRVLSAGDQLIVLLTESKHRGAFEQASVGLYTVCSALWSCPLVEVSQLPDRWLLNAIDSVSAGSTLQLSDTAACPTRRSAGLPLMVQALLTSAPPGGLVDKLQLSIRPLLALTSSTSAAAAVHALNVLRALFRDARLGDSVVPYIADAVRTALLRFRSHEPAVRNSASLLYSALTIRIFGVQRCRQALSKKNCMTSRMFFQRFPSLYQLLLDQLASPPTDGAHVVPILLLLTRLYPSLESDRAATTQYSLVAFLPRLRALSISRVLVVRQLAARVVVAFTAHSRRHVYGQQLVGALEEAVDHGAGGRRAQPAQNSLHGCLLQLEEMLTSAAACGDDWLASSAVADDSAARHWTSTLRSCLHVLPSILAVSSGACAVNRAAACRICSLALQATRQSAEDWRLAVSRVTLSALASLDLGKESAGCMYGLDQLHSAAVQLVWAAGAHGQLSVDQLSTHDALQSHVDMIVEYFRVGGASCDSAGTRLDRELIAESMEACHVTTDGTDLTDESWRLRTADGLLDRLLSGRTQPSVVPGLLDAVRRLHAGLSHRWLRTVCDVIPLVAAAAGGVASCVTSPNDSTEGFEQLCGSLNRSDAALSSFLLLCLHGINSDASQIVQCCGAELAAVTLAAASISSSECLRQASCLLCCALLELRHSYLLSVSSELHLWKALLLLLMDDEQDVRCLAEGFLEATGRPAASSSTISYANGASEISALSLPTVDELSRGSCCLYSTVDLFCARMSARDLPACISTLIDWIFLDDDTNSSAIYSQCTQMGEVDEDAVFDKSDSNGFSEPLSLIRAASCALSGLLSTLSQPPDTLFICLRYNSDAPLTTSIGRTRQLSVAELCRIAALQSSYLLQRLSSDDVTQQLSATALRVDDVTQQLSAAAPRVDDVTQQLSAAARRIDDVTQLQLLRRLCVLKHFSTSQYAEVLEQCQQSGFVLHV